MSFFCTALSASAGYFNIPNKLLIFTSTVRKQCQNTSILRIFFIMFKNIIYKMLYTVNLCIVEIG